MSLQEWLNSELTAWRMSSPVRYGPRPTPIRSFEGTRWWGKGSIIGGNVRLTHSVPPSSVIYNASLEPKVKGRKARVRQAERR